MEIHVKPRMLVLSGEQRGARTEGQVAASLNWRLCWLTGLMEERSSNPLRSFCGESGSSLTGICATTIAKVANGDRQVIDYICHYLPPPGNSTVHQLSHNETLNHSVYQVSQHAIITMFVFSRRPRVQLQYFLQGLPKSTIQEPVNARTIEHSNFPMSLLARRAGS